MQKGHTFVGHLPIERTYRCVLAAGHFADSVTGGINEHGVSMGIEYMGMKPELVNRKGRRQHLQQSLDHFLDRQRADAGEDCPGSHSPHGLDGGGVRVHVLLGSGPPGAPYRLWTRRKPGSWRFSGRARIGLQEAGSRAPSGAHNGSPTGK